MEESLNFFCFLGLSALADWSTSDVTTRCCFPKASHKHTHTHTHARNHAHTHTHAHIASNKQTKLGLEGLRLPLSHSIKPSSFIHSEIILLQSVIFDSVVVVVILVVAVVFDSVVVVVVVILVVAVVLVPANIADG